MVNANIKIFEMYDERSVTYFKSLENLEKIRLTNGLGLDTLAIGNKNIYIAYQ
jgi:hypothetical protein